MVRVMSISLIKLNSVLLDRRPCRLDAVIERHASDDRVFSLFRKSAYSGGCACDHHERSRPGTNERSHRRISGFKAATVLVARASRDPDALPHGRIPGSLGPRTRMGQDLGSSEI
jgi:hypothetical protein